MATAGEGRRSLQGSIITGDDIEDYRTVPPMSLVLSPTPSRPTEADVDLVREAVRQTVLDGLRTEAGADADDVDVDVSFDLGEVVELTFVPDDGDGRGGSKLRRRNLASSVASAGTGSRRRTQDATSNANAATSSSSAYTIVGFGESQVTYRAPLLSDFTPPSQTAFEEKTWVAVADDATAKIPDAIRTAVAASVGGSSSGSGVLAGLQGATADLAYEPPVRVPGSGAAEEVKQEPSETEAEPVEVPEPEPVEVPEPEPVEEEPQPVEEEMPEEEEDEKIEEILTVEEEVAQPPDSAKEGSDGETLTIPRPPPTSTEEEQTATVEKEQTDEEEAGAATEAQPSAPVQEEETEVDDEPQQDEEQEGNEEEEQEEQTIILPMPTPEDGEKEEATAGIPAKDDEKQDTISSPQDSAVPPPLFGGGDYTGDSSVSSVGIAEGGADGTVSRGGGAGDDGPAIGAIVGGCMAALLAILFIAAMFVKQRRRRQALEEEGGKRTKLEGDVEDGGELGADNTFELDDSGELMLNGMHVEPADGNRSNDARLLSQGDDEGSEEGKTGGSGYLPTGLFGSFVSGNKSARRKASPKSVATSMDEENSDEEDSILTDWSGAPSVNSLGHSVQGSVADDEPTSVTNDLAKTYDLSKSRSGGANVLLQFQKKKERKRSKSMDLYGQQPNVRTEEDFERQRNAASISLRKDMMCTVDGMSAYPMHGRSRSADHGLLASGTFLGPGSPEAPEAAWIWGSRNEADMRPKNGGGQELQML